MRWVAMVFGLLGLAGCVLVAFVMMDGIEKGKQLLQEKKTDMAKVRQDVKSGQIKDSKVGQALLFLDRNVQAQYFLFAGAGLALFGTILALARRRFSATILFLCAILGPVVLIPNEQRVALLIFTAGLPLAVLFSLFIGPARPRPAIAQ